MAVAITREGLSAADLRREAARSRDADAARRMLAIALVLDGHSREDAAAACGMDCHWGERGPVDALRTAFAAFPLAPL